MKKKHETTLNSLIDYAETNISHLKETCKALIDEGNESWAKRIKVIGEDVETHRRYLEGLMKLKGDTDE